jgi:putative ABC transport system ATP-binding protein
VSPDEHGANPQRESGSASGSAAGRAQPGASSERDGHSYAVHLAGVAKEYRLGSVRIAALRGVTLGIRAGEYVSIMGPSGSGKSTLFNMIGGLDRPTEGAVAIEGVDIARLSGAELAQLRCRRIGYIFQIFNLVPSMTALENCMLPLVFAGGRLPEAREKAGRLLEAVGLGDRRAHRPIELSGGQQQRVAIARALANDPAILLADEPTGNLDLDTGHEIIALLKRLNEERGVTVVSATHDLKMLDASARIVHIQDGTITRIEERSADSGGRPSI